MAPGKPINTLYDGTRNILLPDGQTVKITVQFPTDAAGGTPAWRDVDTNMKLFHPDLDWFGNRSPQYRVWIATQTAGTPPVERAKRIRLETRWKPPMGMAGGTDNLLTMDTETVVYSDFN